MAYLLNLSSSESDTIVYALRDALCVGYEFRPLVNLTRLVEPVRHALFQVFSYYSPDNAELVKRWLAGNTELGSSSGVIDASHAWSSPRMVRLLTQELNPIARSVIESPQPTYRFYRLLDWLGTHDGNGGGSETYAIRDSRNRMLVSAHIVGSVMARYASNHGDTFSFLGFTNHDELTTHVEHIPSSLGLYGPPVIPQTALCRRHHMFGCSDITDSYLALTIDLLGAPLHEIAQSSEQPVPATYIKSMQEAGLATIGEVRAFRNSVRSQRWESLCSVEDF